jgi:hypothetical protein
MPYIIEGENVIIRHEPQLKDGTLWVPFRALGQVLGGNVDWDPDGRVAILYLNDHIVTTKIGDATVNMDGEDYELQAPPYLDDGDTWIPVRFFNQPLGYQLEFDLKNNLVKLTSPLI